MSAPSVTYPVYRFSVHILFAPYRLYIFCYFPVKFMFTNFLSIFFFPSFLSFFLTLELKKSTIGYLQKKTRAQNLNFWPIYSNFKLERKKHFCSALTSFCAELTKLALDLYVKKWMCVRVVCVCISCLFFKASNWMIYWLLTVVLATYLSD